MIKNYLFVHFLLHIERFHYKSLLSIAIVLLMFMPVTSQAGMNKTAGWHEINIEHGGQLRYFRYFIPSRLDVNPAVVLLFHGGRQSMRKIFRKRAGGSQEWETLAEENSFLLLVPNGVNVKNGDTKGDKQNWNDCRVAVQGTNSAANGDDVGFVDEMLEWAKIHFQINESRVYVTGASNGGLMSLRLITELSDRIAAAAVFIANQPVKTDCIQPKHPVPLFMMSATEDPLMLWQGGQIRNEGAEMLSVADTLDYWLKVNRVDVDKVVTKQLPDLDTGDGSVIIKNAYPAKAGGQPVWFYEIRGAGHTTPSIKHDVPFFARLLVGKQNKDLEASHEAWKFLQQFNNKNPTSD